MITQRNFHSSCILGHCLYVHGGSDEYGYCEVGSALPIERLANINKRIGEASNRWESLVMIDLSKLLHLMIPLNNSEEILILGTAGDIMNFSSPEYSKINPKKSTQKVVDSDFDFHYLTFDSNQHKISNDGQNIVTIARDVDSEGAESSILISF